jgi:hypothetical protein
MKTKESPIVLKVLLEHHRGDRTSRPYDVVILGCQARRGRVQLLFKDSIVPPACHFGRLFLPALVADGSAMESFKKANSTTSEEV